MNTFEGNVIEIIFRNNDNGYTVGVLGTAEEEITFVGTFIALEEGEHILIKGMPKLHPIYGQQIEVISYELPTLNTDKSIFNYLASGAIDEIGPKLAERIVNHFGSKTLEIMDNHPERLLEIEGIGRKKFNRIITSYLARSAQRSIVVKLAGYDISTSIAMKIYRAFGEDTIRVITENPYMIASKIRGIGFLKADEIARKLGADMNSIHRITEGIKYALEEYSYQGNTYSLVDELADRSMLLLGCDRERFEEGLYELCIKKEAILENKNAEKRVYLESMYRCETDVAYMLLRLLGQPSHCDILSRDAEIMVKEAEVRIGKTLDQKQYDAVLAALQNQVMVLTGGPGTGKTTIISFIIDCFEGLGKKVKLCAPTGRAAKRMSEATGINAKTIHRMLEVGFTGSDEESFYNRNEENPILADVIIVDEVSMVDIFLMRALLKAVSPGTILIFVGDKDQLPSVGVGRVLWDLIDSAMIKTVTLTEIFRQSKESSIIINAHRVNRGESLEIKKGDSDFFFMARSNTNDAKKLVVELVSERLPKYFGIDSKEIQVLSPIKKSGIGVIELNQSLQEKINPLGNQIQFRHQERYLRVGDKIMQIKNNYDKDYIGYYGTESGKGVFNGDIGTIDSIDPKVKEFFITWEDQRRSRYSYDEADNIEHAYAMTVHKSQGSEFDVVVIPILSLPPMMQSRNILYTALTRAKNAVILVGSMNHIQRMIDNISIDKRNSSLSDKIKSMHKIVLEE
ncbi:MAG: ATP-dependent RecD-like DNA helicase [Peptostreptococcaceae bacterium]|nr:ATP-dependent RecD-like DNA helicase [Peptostreptococcaceae bacterium]